MKNITSRLFIKNFALIFSLPVLLILLFVVSSVVYHSFIAREIEDNSIRTLRQLRSSSQLIFGDLDSLNLTFSTNTEISMTLKRIFRSPEFGFMDFKTLDTIQAFINAPSNARPYLHSIYVYINNERGYVLTSNDGLTTVEACKDNAWFTAFTKRSGEAAIWTERRELFEYSFQKDPIELVTLYRTITVVGSERVNGVIVLNIDEDYLQTMLNAFAVHPEQIFVVLDQSGTVVLTNGDQAIIETPRPNTDITGEALTRREVDGRSYVVAGLPPGRYGWTYMSLTPENVFFGLLHRIQGIAAVFIAAAVAVGLLMTLYLTRKNTVHLQAIYDIIAAAEAGQPLPPAVPRKQDVYHYIIANVLRTFITNEYLRVRLSERQYRSRTLELLALQSQMNPHFLFNTLETLNWKVLELVGRRTDANAMVEKLSLILKYSLQPPDDTISLRDEIEYVSNYVAIQKMRYKDKFELAWDIRDDALLNTRCIRLLLQPLVENAIYHGIKPKEGPGRIVVRIDRRDDRLLITVADDGVGLDPERLTAIVRELETESLDYTHIGLHNTHKRIRLFYGDGCGLRIDGAPGEGTVVTLTLPCVLQSS